ncbi:MAG: DUF3761 domain-containing protein [Burkholderiaceae bacterium]|nr:DUF3761 domain-containing protein [Roseateles sp.]MBV8469371.1 DUF3761 domain-containing protein [Burkholderiaceae bacterium]
MNVVRLSVSFAASLMLSSACLAQQAASAPAGSTGLCKDGTYTTNATKKGSCNGHKGVKEWYGAAADAGGKPAANAAPATAAPAATATAKAAAATAQAPGGGAGQVWVNSSSKVYHCPGTKYYGKTKEGEYMTEAAAKAAGNHADHGKSCS